MLEVHPASDGFTVYDTDAGEAVITFASRAEADDMIAMLQIADVHGELQSWAPVAVPLAY
jgi:dsDNA-binding SOS-regulon protein